MSQIHVNPVSSRKWLWGLALILVAGATGLVWWTRAQQGAHSRAMTTTAAPSAPDALSLASAASVPAAPVSTAEEVSQVIKQQLAAKAVLEKQPVVPPVKGLITERPPYVSVLEWQLLQGAAHQHAHPEQELTRLVNSLRFTKQLEQWQDLPQNTDMATRKALATPLLEDLPERVKEGDMDLAGARTLQAALLADVVPDLQARTARAAAEGARLSRAAEAYASAMAAASSSSAP